MQFFRHALRRKPVVRVPDSRPKPLASVFHYFPFSIDSQAVFFAAVDRNRRRPGQQVLALERSIDAQIFCSEDSASTQGYPLGSDIHKWTIWIAGFSCPYFPCMDPFSAVRFKIPRKSRGYVSSFRAGEFLIEMQPTECSFEHLQVDLQVLPKWHRRGKLICASRDFELSASPDSQTRDSQSGVVGGRPGVPRNKPTHPQI